MNRSAERARQFIWSRYLESLCSSVWSQTSDETRDSFPSSFETGECNQSESLSSIPRGNYPEFKCHWRCHDSWIGPGKYRAVFVCIISPDRRLKSRRAERKAEAVRELRTRDARNRSRVFVGFSSTLWSLSCFEVHHVWSRGSCFTQKEKWTLQCVRLQYLICIGVRSGSYPILKCLNIK